jgi:DNA-binding NarL/FixJ family response regulator
MRIIALEEFNTPASIVPMIREAGYDCEAVGDEQRCYARCLGTSRDVALIDMESPSVTGPGFMRSLSERFPKLHVLAVSANDDESVVESALGAGAKAFLLKPVSQLTIAQVLSRLAQGDGEADSQTPSGR